MCGLISIISKHKNGFYMQDVDIFTQMLFSDQLRGADGTGVFYNNKKNIKVAKAPMASSDFIVQPKYDQIEKDIFNNANFVVGHNRAATLGKLTHENTHPHRFGHITLVHNGTLVSHKHLADVENDSMAICQAIARDGFHSTIKKVNGAFALIWFDAKQKTLNLCRNSQRPLWLVETKDLLCFVSEPKMADWIFTRNRDIVIKTEEIPVNTLYQFEAGKWDTYHTSKFDTYTYAPQQSGWLPYNHVPVKSGGSPSKSMIGRTVSFIPIEVDPSSKEKLIGEWEDTVSGELIECRFWAGSPVEAEKLLKNQVLKGTISHTGWGPKGTGEFFILKNVYASTVTALLDQKKSEGGVVTANGKKLTYQQASQISKTLCLSCSAPIGELLQACDIYEEDGYLTGMCPECTHHIYNHQQIGMYQ